MAGQSTNLPGPAAPPPPVSPIPRPFEAPDVTGLQLQLGELQIQLKGLQAQWDALRVQLDNMLRNNPARPGVQQQWADVGVQIAKTKGEIALVEARIAQKQGVFTTTEPARAPRGGIDVNKAFPVGAVLLMVLAFPVSIAWARRITRGRSAAVPFPADHAMRLDRIEQAIDAVAIEVERISEGQRFVTKILIERPERATSVDAAGSAPPLALGAAPMEPIRVPERDRARQPIITPH